MWYALDNHSQLVGTHRPTAGWSANGELLPLMRFSSPAAPNSQHSGRWLTLGTSEVTTNAVGRAFGRDVFAHHRRLLQLFCVR